MTFSGVPTLVGGGDPSLASYLEGSSNERFEFQKKKIINSLKFRF